MCINFRSKLVWIIGQTVKKTEVRIIYHFTNCVWRFHFQFCLHFMQFYIIKFISEKTVCMTLWFFVCQTYQPLADLLGGGAQPARAPLGLKVYTFFYSECPPSLYMCPPPRFWKQKKKRCLYSARLYPRVATVPPPPPTYDGKESLKKVSDDVPPPPPRLAFLGLARVSRLAAVRSQKLVFCAPPFSKFLYPPLNPTFIFKEKVQFCQTTTK